MGRHNVNPQHLPWWLRETTKRTQSAWLEPGFELGTLRIRVQCDEFRSALYSVHSKTLSQTHFTVGGSWNKSLQLQPQQRCYCENSMTYTEWLHAINGLLAVGQVGNLLDGHPSHLRFDKKIKILNSYSTYGQVDGWDALKPLYWRFMNSKDTGRPRLSHHHEDKWNQWNAEMVEWNLW